MITTGVSMAVAYFLGTVFRLKRSQRAFAMAAAMFMNSNSLPIALMQSLVITVPGLKWGDADTESAMIGRALTYLVLHSTLGMVVSGPRRQGR
jgi:predicted permease